MKNKKKNKKKNNKKKKNKKKRAPDPPGYLRPNSFVPRAPKGTHAGESRLASTKCHCLHTQLVRFWGKTRLAFSSDYLTIRKKN